MWTLTSGALPAAFCTTRNILVTSSMTWQVWITRSPFHLFPKEGERAEDDDSDCWKCKQPVWRFGTLGEVLSNYKMKKSRWSGRVQLTSQLTGLIKIATPYSNLWMGKLYKKKEKDEITDLTWKTAMSSRNGLSEMRTISDAGTRYLIFKVRWSKIIMELVDTTNSTGTNFWRDMQIICH